MHQLFFSNGSPNTPPWLTIQAVQADETLNTLESIARRGARSIVWSLFIALISDKFFRIKEIMVYPDGLIEYRVNPK
jgi:hypothetical protein